MSQPLISDAVLSGMYTSAQQLRSARQTPGFAADLPRSKRAHLIDQPEAMLAALLSQLHRRDTVLACGDARLLQIAADVWFPHGNGPALHALHSGDEECAAIAAGMALRIADWAQPAGSTAGQSTPRPVVIALLNSLPLLPSILRLVQDHDLALLLVAGGELKPRAEAQRHLQSTTVPILQVDRADAVAVCRVTQECLLRARNGWGGAVLHAVPLPDAMDSLQLLEQHLAKRGLATV